MIGFKVTSLGSIAITGKQTHSIGDYTFDVKASSKKKEDGAEVNKGEEQKLDIKMEVVPIYEDDNVTHLRQHVSN